MLLTFLQRLSSVNWPILSPSLDHDSMNLLWHVKCVSPLGAAALLRECGLVSKTLSSPNNILSRLKLEVNLRFGVFRGTRNHYQFPWYIFVLELLVGGIELSNGWTMNELSSTLLVLRLNLTSRLWRHGVLQMKLQSTMVPLILVLSLKVATMAFSAPSKTSRGTTVVDNKWTFCLLPALLARRGQMEVNNRDWKRKMGWHSFRLWLMLSGFVRLPA